MNRDHVLDVVGAFGWGIVFGILWCWVADWLDGQPV